MVENICLKETENAVMEGSLMVYQDFTALCSPLRNSAGWISIVRYACDQYMMFLRVSFQ